ncbi:hypothetical protein BDZ89DRAFT_832346 [Hymenopellis radicata]|nr:hypothetical protein BDZ89DRAFT_832346 [Hymenopellis radicata]
MPAGLLLVEQLLRLVHSASYEVGQFKFGDAQNEVLVRVIWNVLRRVVLHALDRGFTDVVERAEDVWKPQGSTAVLHATSQAGEPLNLRWLTDLVDHRHSQDWRTFKKDQHSAKKEQKEELRTKENLAQAKKDLHRLTRTCTGLTRTCAGLTGKLRRAAGKLSRRAGELSRRAGELTKSASDVKRRAEELRRLTGELKSLPR